ncbi:MAG: alpha/beta hydrolase [Planctomycetota bacterium]
MPGLQSIAPLSALLFLLAGCATAAATTAGVRTATAASSDGLPIAYDEQGRGDAALVFVHGWCCNRSFWAAQTSLFAADHRVVTLDLGGHGASGRARAEWKLESLARDVAAVVETLDLHRAVLVGHSMGGPVCLLAARLLPDRVAGVVGVDTLHDADFVYPEGMWDEVQAGLEADFAGFTRGFVAQMFPPDADPALQERVAATMSAADPAVGLALIRAMRGFDPQAALRACPAPVRCINAAGEMATDVAGNRAYAPSFDAVTMSGVGHFLMMERPGEFNLHLAAVVRELLAARR